MRTTLDLPDALFKEVKTRAVQQGVKLKDLLAIYIEAGLRSPSLPREATPPSGKRHALPVGIPRIPGTPLHPAMTNAELNAILDAEDLTNYLSVTKPSAKTE